MTYTLYHTLYDDDTAYLYTTHIHCDCILIATEYRYDLHCNEALLIRSKLESRVFDDDDIYILNASPSCIGIT